MFHGSICINKIHDRPFLEPKPYLFYGGSNP